MGQGQAASQGPGGRGEGAQLEYWMKLWGGGSHSGPGPLGGWGRRHGIVP